MADTELRRWAIDAAVRSGSPDIISTAKMLVDFVEGGGAAPTKHETASRWGPWTDERIACLKAAREAGVPMSITLDRLNNFPGAPIVKHTAYQKCLRMGFKTPKALPRHSAAATRMHEVVRKRGLNGTAG